MELITPGYNIIRPFSHEDAIAELKYIELEARRCYKSEDKITDDSYLKKVQQLRVNNHNAMLGFGELHVEFICDRGVSHEIVRHRIAEYAQESTRYCNYGGKGIQVICPDEIMQHSEPEVFNVWSKAMAESEYAYNQLIDFGLKPQIARSVLPTALKTEIGVKANFQEWRHIFSQRTPATAHPQMREIMVPLLAILKVHIPIVFDDL